jgi:serine/threonine protein kinase
VEPSDLDRASCVFDFVEMYLRDDRAGRARELTEHQARFPGFEEAIAQEWETLQDDGTPDTGSTLPQVPGFTLLGELGHGGQGAVFLAEETDLGRRVALKLIHTPTRRIPERRRARLRREVEIVAGLDHPGLCPVHSADLEQNRLMGVYEGWSTRPEFQPYHAVFDLDFTPDGSHVVAACQDLCVRAWSLEGGRSSCSSRR